jgi:hypothetical protein
MINITARQYVISTIVVYTTVLIVIGLAVRWDKKNIEKCRSKDGVWHDSSCYSRASVESLVRIDLDK